MEFLATVTLDGTEHELTRTYAEMIAHQVADKIGRSRSRQTRWAIATVYVRNPNGTNVTKCWRPVISQLFRDGQPVTRTRG